MLSFFVAFGVINGSIVLAKVTPKKTEQFDEKKLSPKEEKEKSVKNIKKVLEKYETLEKEIQKKIDQKFKNFNEKNYEVENYDLEVFKKNNAPILVYTHKKTGAQVYFNLFLHKDSVKDYSDKLIFRAPSKDDCGLIHFTENCIAKFFIDNFKKNLKKTRDFFITHKTEENITFSSNSVLTDFDKKLEKKYVEKLAKELKDPSVFKEGNKIFEFEKRRILNELKDFKGPSYFAIEDKEMDLKRRFNYLGNISDVEKVSFKDFKDFYENYINPSNCLLIKNVFELNSNSIKNYLNLWHENYFKYFKKKEVKNNRYELKNKAKYMLNNRAKDSEFFNLYGYSNKTNGYKKINYRATLSFNEEIFKEKQKQIFNLNFLPFEKELNFLFKSLGYEKPSYLYRNSIYFYGNKKDCFTKKALEENSKKIMNFIAEKLEGLNEKDFLYLRYYDYKFYNKKEIEDLNLKNAPLWTHPNVFQGYPMFYLVETSFNKTGKAISDKFFVIKKDNEIESSYEISNNSIKQNLKSNSNIYKKFAEKGPQYIDVFKKDAKKTLKQMFGKEKEKYKKISGVLPIKFKEKSSKKFVRDFAIQLLSEFLNEELNVKRGFVYKDLKAGCCFENDFLISYSLNKDSVKDLEDFVFKNFNEIIKNFKITEKDLNELKNKYKEKFKFFEDKYKTNFKGKSKIVKDFENYIKTKKADEKSVLKEDFKIRDFFRFYYGFLLLDVDENLFTSFDDFKDYEFYFKKEMDFEDKYLKKLNDKITPEVAKDFLENLLKPMFKKLEEVYKKSEEKLKALDKIKISDVKDLIATLYLVENKEEIEKVNKNIRAKEEKEESFSKAYLNLI